MTKEKIREVVEKIFYSPATNGKAEESINNGVQLINSLLTPSADVQERAKEYAKKESDSVGGLSPERIDAIAGHYLAGASSVSGMQWVKASVLPTEPGRYNIRVMEAGEWQPDTANFTLGRWEVFSDDVDVFEWLDESGASSLQAENERLREALTAIKLFSSEWDSNSHNEITLIAAEALTKQ